MLIFRLVSTFRKSFDQNKNMYQIGNQTNNQSLHFGLFEKIKHHSYYKKNPFT